MRLATSLLLVSLLFFPPAALPSSKADSLKRVLFDLIPSSTPTGGSGLINLQTVPNNPVGCLAISLHGFLLQHDVFDIENEIVGTGMLGLTYSLSRDFELYFSASFFATAQSIEPNLTLVDSQKGFGSQEIGLKFRMPLRRTGVFQMGGSVGAVLGMSKIKVAGYNVFNTRRRSDVKLRLVQSLRFQDRYGLPNLHFNEGYVTLYGDSPDLLMLGVGADYWLSRHLQLLTEYESRLEQRTPIHPYEDYMTLTTALRYHTGGSVSFTLGGNFGLSHDREFDSSWRRSDPWQVFLGVTFAPKPSATDLDRDGIPDWLDAETAESLRRRAAIEALTPPADDDVDGVPNDRDVEPNTPLGARVDVRGMAYDIDRDGVPDGLDEEPNSPFGVPVDSRGVGKDSDGDGVPDGIDLENNSPEGAPVDAWGRSLIMITGGMNALPSIPDVSLIRFPNVHFDLGKADIKPESYSTLDLVGETLSKYPMLVLLIEGHADSTGSVKRNNELSLQRAQAVRSYLLTKFPVLNRSNFAINAFGESDPKVDNGTDEGRIQNRRVEFKVLNREVLQKRLMKE